MPATGISYRDLASNPSVLALLAAATFVRLGARMFSLSVVLYAIARFDSPVLAGWISFAAIAPGLLISPLAGAFLDRAGAVRGVVLDLIGSTIFVSLLFIADARASLDAPLLIVLVTLYSLTNPLSAAGIRVLVPRLVPAQALDRANALDTAIHAVVDVVGPPLAGVLMGFGGAGIAFGAVVLAYALATLCILLVRAGPAPGQSQRPLLSQALLGLLLVCRDRSLRGLAVGYSLSLVTWGILVVTVPVCVERHFGDTAWEPIVGLLWAGAGIAGGLGALLAGQLRVQGREVPVMAVGMIITSFAMWPLAAEFGLPGLGLGMALFGLMAGPIDVGVLTLRQRRTDPAQLGRVLTVSMSVNMAGFPIGTVIGGMLVSWTPSVAFIAAAMASILAAAMTWTLIPAERDVSRPDQR